MSTQRLDPRIGTDFGPYRIESVIGRGGMGVVYRATQANLGRKVALKVLSPDLVDEEAFRQRFVRESQMAAAIDHPNIIPIYEAGEVEGTTFLAMRFVDGTDLATRIRGGPLEPRVVVSVLAQVAGALDASHAAGLVHRDVKPANLLLASGHSVDRADHVYLTDFGLTKQRGSETALTRTGSFLGTLEYVSPEQIEGKPVDGRADQYSLAAIAVECLTGAAPFPRDSDLAIVNAHLRDAPPSIHQRRPDLPVEVDAVIARAMAKDPTARYPDCWAFVDALRDALGVTATGTRPIADAFGARDLRRVVVFGGLVAAVVIAIAVFALASGGSAGTSPSAQPSMAVVFPSQSLAPSPTENIFPNEAEAALLTTLPDDLAASCVRGPYEVLYGGSLQIGGVGGQIPVASLACQPPARAGATSAVIRRFSSAGRSGFVSGVISYVAAGSPRAGADAAAAGRRVPPGDCARSSRANGRWELSGSDIGALICYTERSSGDAFLWWSYDDDYILVKATNQRGDSAALYDWFEQNARFIAP